MLFAAVGAVMGDEPADGTVSTFARFYRWPTDALAVAVLCMSNQVIKRKDMDVVAGIDGRRFPPHGYFGCWVVRMIGPTPPARARAMSAST